MKINVTDVVHVSMHVMKRGIGLVDGKAKLLLDDYCDGLEIVCLNVRQELNICAKEKRLHMMSRQLLPIKHKRKKSRKKYLITVKNACCSSGISQSQLDSGLVR